MFFQINVTPKEKKVRKSSSDRERAESEQQESFTLVLAPFQPQTRIKLESTVYNPVKCCLTIENPSNRNLNVTVVKTPPKERSIELSTLELLVEAESSTELDIVWNPQEIGSWRDTLQLLDSRRIKYEVALITTANGVKKAKGQGRSRVLGPSNVNKSNASSVRARRISPPLARGESKKNVNTTSLNLLNVPSKRPRLNVQHENKENSTRVDWSYQVPDGKPTSFLSSPGPHDFSAMMNSTKFNLTPLKPNGCDDPMKLEVRTTEGRDINFSPQQAGILSPETTNVPNLRRETYTAAKYCKSNVIIKEPEQEDDENFVDSLSPQPEGQHEESVKKPSDFSVLINNMNLLTPNTPVHPQSSVNFSPKDCSTGNRTRSLAENLSSNEASTSHTFGGNNTFDVSASKVGNNSRANSTYELPTSPTRSTSLEPIKPTRLSKSFGIMSPVMLNISSERSKPTLSSSSPICFEAVPTPREYSTRTSISHVSQLNYDDASVKEVLEADLWAKSESEQSGTFFGSSIKGRCASLERIDEEKSCAGFNRTKTFELPRKETKPVKARRIEISPPNKYSSSRKTAAIRKVSPTKSSKIRKEKNLLEPASSLRKRVQMNCSIKRGQVSIPGVRIANLSLTGLTRGNAKDKIVRSEPKEVSVKLHDPNDFLTRFCNPDPFGATMTQDPFLTSTLYYDDKWMHHQETEFKKWLNALLTSPEHLNADVDTIRVDVGKVWQSCRAREDVALAETREAVSARYHTNTRLNTLRKAACAMFRREEVTTALSKATVCIERGTLMIRQDRDLHRDIGLQKEILELFLSYNPLWLRIGLEAVYGETIPLHSNNDLVGLTRFLITRFFSDPFIVKTHSHSTTASLKLPSFAVHMNKFILKKFILIVFFLDYAKRNKLIGHDPCLFHKRATHKESRAVLLTFSREVLSGVGDVTKVLRAHGYVVSHKQTYLDEYDYAVKDIAVDLRDGVRLCRVMELITGDRNLTYRCRVPAISRLQKVHNADLALTALLRCDYKITGDIDAKSVADGHREKTLSLLWQIIYKYQAPRFDKAAKIVQQWWRSKLWYVRVRYFLRNRKDNAASTIQRAWRCYRARKSLDQLRSERARLWAEREDAVRIIQLRWIERMKMMKERRNFLVAKEAVLRIQRWVRRRRETGPFVDNFREKCRAIATIQQHWRAQVLMRRERNNYLVLVSASIKIQSWWRARRAGLEVYQSYQKIRKATIVVQSKWRALRLMKIAKEAFQVKLNAVRKIQSWWRRILALKRDRNTYLLKKNAARTIEVWWIGERLVKIHRKKFKLTRKSAISIQRTWRRYSETRNDVRDFKERIRACRNIQQWWRSARVAKRYNLEKKSCITIQRWWRGVVMTKSEVASFSSLRGATIIVQKTWRMRKIRRDYLRTKEAVAKIESWYNNALLSRAIRQDFIKKRSASLTIQKWWRCLNITWENRNNYLEYRRTVIAVQNRWRSNIVRKDYLRKRQAAIILQKNWRMLRTMKEYRKLRNAAVVLQTRWRSRKHGIEIRTSYVSLRNATIDVQRRYRAKKIGLQAKQSYLQLRSAVLNVQRRLRANRSMKEDKKRFLEYRNASIVLQSQWRMIVEMRIYRSTRKAALTIQSKWRARTAGRESRAAYLRLKASVLLVQRRYRANKACKIAREEYTNTRKKIIRVQRLWRKKLENRMHEEASINIQTWWRSIVEMRECRQRYECQKAAVLVIQERYRAYKLGSKVRREFALVIISIVKIQRAWRYFARQKRHEEWLRDCKEAALVIENWWILMMEKKRMREAELALLNKKIAAATKIQTAWRGHNVRMSQSATMKELRERLEKAAKAAVPSATVAFQMQESMNMFLACDTIGQLSMCLATLDTLTRLTPKGCIAFCQLNLVDKVYGTLAMSNRSLPWIEVCVRCTNILITLTKLPDTRNYVYRVEYIETLARLMSITVEKHVNLFLRLSTLIWLLTENQNYAEAITSCPRSCWLLTSLHVSINKKKSRLSMGNLNKSRGREQVAPLPNSKPDWGLKQKRPRLFTTVHHAISSLIKRLKIETAT